MPKRVTSSPDPVVSRRPPATTPEGREQQLIAAAVDLAEQQMYDGTASAQVITHYLKLGSSRERLEQKRIEQENELTAAKIQALADTKDIKDMYSKALLAMSAYKGIEEPVDAEYVDEDL